MRCLVFAFVIVVLMVGVVSADVCQAMTCLDASNVAYVRIENWQQPDHPFAAFIKIDGVWRTMAVGQYGFTAVYTSAPVEGLIAALLSIPVDASTENQPMGVHLDSRHDQATPVDFCAQLYTTYGEYFAVCADRSEADDYIAYLVMNSAFHQEAWFIGNADSDAAVLVAMRNL